MAMAIWETDPENKPEKRQDYSDDTVGRLHSGYMDETDPRKPKPVALTKWRFSTGEKPVGDAAAELFGGTPVENENPDVENFIDVFTDATKVPVIIEPGTNGIDSDMKEWRNGKLVHHCDGVRFLSHLSNPAKVGDECGCPKLFAERKQAAKDFMGPSPSITVHFRLAEDPALGLFKYQTSSWTLAKILHEAEEAVETVGQGSPVFGFLELEYVEFVLTKGKDRGKTVSYTKPVIRIVKKYDDAIADDAE